MPKGLPDNSNFKLDVSRETIDRLILYSDLVRKWNPAINLVAKSTLEDIWSRHILDSVDVYKAANIQNGLWVDMGSGGGFPGVVIALVAAEMAPDMQVTLIESDIRKASFLRTVSRETGVKMGILSRRIEEVPPQNAQTVSARALAPLTKLLGYAKRHLAKGGHAVFPKGETWQREVEEALASWTFTVENTPSTTHPGSAILKVGDINRA